MYFLLTFLDDRVPPGPLLLAPPLRLNSLGLDCLPLLEQLDAAQLGVRVVLVPAGVVAGAQTLVLARRCWSGRGLCRRWIIILMRLCSCVSGVEGGDYLALFVFYFLFSILYLEALILTCNFPGIRRIELSSFSCESEFFF